MVRPIAQNRETHFSENELFFSRTDKRGIIQSGNDVFVRISGYGRSQLVGVAHNIVRHPDMPKAVFKVLWDTIAAGKPISAYVKNLASDGSYYWVFATVFPIPEGYLSIRLKPSTDFFGKIPDLYRQILEKERKENVDSSLKFLLQSLAAMGFKNYDDFTIQAMFAEINQRVRRQAENSGKNINHDVNLLTQGILGEIAGFCSDSRNIALRTSSRLESFESLSRQLAEKTTFVLKTLKSVDLLAINMSTAARRLGAAGVSLVAIADGIQASASEFRHSLQQFEKSSLAIGQQIRTSGQKIGASHLQVDMIDFYVHEVLRSGGGSGQVDASVLQDMQCNARFLVGLAHQTVDGLIQEMQNFGSELRKIYGEVSELESTVGELEIIRKTGKIEASRVIEGAAEFNSFFEGMHDLVQNTRTQLQGFGDALRTFARDVESSVPELNQLAQQLKNVERLNEGL